MTANTRYYELIASEFPWQISDGRTITAWGFNGTVPGPQIRAKQGDRVVVKVTNNLREPTIIHWHGIRLMASMDGTADVQKPIAPGEEFEYRFEVPDAGTFWYHSHRNETEQMERGMYGSLIVEEETDPVVDGERTFMIDDMKLTASNDFRRGNPLQRWVERHDGREGDTVLINGKENPVIRMNAGQSERWRFINSSSARYFRLSLGGRSFRIIGTDGGLIQSPYEVSELLIVPGERFDIVAGPFAEGENFPVESLAYNRMTMKKPRRRSFAQVEVGQQQESISSVPGLLRGIQPLAGQHAPVTRRVNFSVGVSLTHGIDFLVNQKLHGGDQPVYTGELQVWEVSNTSLMDHPFHLHGFFFQVLEVNGKQPAYAAWKDTVNLPPRSRVKIAWLADNRTGKWMYHCHILEHHEAGMMSHFEVINPSSDGQQASEMLAESCHIHG